MARPVTSNPKVIVVMQNEMGAGRNPFAAYVPPDGITYQWTRTALCGDPDLEPMTTRVANGWFFVTPDAHPEASVLPLSDSIKSAGLVLMQRPTIEVEAEHAKVREESERRLAAAKAALEALGATIETTIVTIGDESTT